MATAKQKGKSSYQGSFDYNTTAENILYVGYLRMVDAQSKSTLNAKSLSFECGICYEKFITATVNASSSRGPVHGQFLSCKHGYCDICLNKYVTTKLRDGVNPFPMQCPIPECHYEITEKYVQSLLTARDYDLWKRKKEESNMNGKMYCPNKRCSKVLTISQLSQVNNCLTECTYCHYAICTKCTCLWHNGYSCAQYKTIPDEQRNAEDKSVLTMAKNNKWCRCTECKVLVELRYGCNHITCHCGHQFCYKCNSPWNETTKLCSSGKCSLWDEDMLILAQNDREPPPPQVQQRVQPPQIRQPQIQPPQRQPPQVRQVKVQKAREIDIDFRKLSQIPHYKLPPWLYESLHDLQCMYCFADLNSLNQLKQHLETVMHHDVYYCCGKLFRTKESFTRHRWYSSCRQKANYESEKDYESGDDDDDDETEEDDYENEDDDDDDYYESDEEYLGHSPIYPAFLF